MGMRLSHRFAHLFGDGFWENHFDFLLLVPDSSSPISPNRGMRILLRGKTAGTNQVSSWCYGNFACCPAPAFLKLSH